MNLSEKFSLVFTFVIAIATAFNIFLWITTRQALDESKKATQGSFILELNRDFFLNDRLYKLRRDIESGAPIFKENGGRFVAQDIDDYIGYFELMSNLIDRKILDSNLIEDNFGEAIIYASKNKEIIRYVSKLRKELNEPDIYYGFDDLAIQFSKNLPPPPLPKTMTKISKAKITQPKKNVTKNSKTTKTQSHKTMTTISKTTTTQPYKATTPKEHQRIRMQSPPGVVF